MIAIAATAIAPHARGRWLEQLDRKLDPPARRSDDASRQARTRQRRRDTSWTAFSSSWRLLVALGDRAARLAADQGEAACASCARVRQVQRPQEQQGASICAASLSRSHSSSTVNSFGSR
jgi:hypothetical protein